MDDLILSSDEKDQPLQREFFVEILQNIGIMEQNILALSRNLFSPEESLDEIFCSFHVIRRRMEEFRNEKSSAEVLKKMKTILTQLYRSPPGKEGLSDSFFAEIGESLDEMKKILRALPVPRDLRKKFRSESWAGDEGSFFSLLSPGEAVQKEKPGKRATSGARTEALPERKAPASVLKAVFGESSAKETKAEKPGGRGAGEESDGEGRLSADPSLELSVRLGITDKLQEELEKMMIRRASWDRAEQGLNKMGARIKKIESELELAIRAFGTMRDREGGERMSLDPSDFKRIQSVWKETAVLNTNLKKHHKFFTDHNLRTKQNLSSFRGILTKMRMTPFTPLAEDLSRHLKKISPQKSSRIRWSVTGGETLLDRALLEELKPVLREGLRHAVLYGIESPSVRSKRKKTKSGKIHLGIRRDKDRYFFDLSDDGGGLDLGAGGIVLRKDSPDGEIRLTMEELFSSPALRGPGRSRPGSATSSGAREKVMHLISGLRRIHERIEQRGGSIELTIRPGKGTRLLIMIPASFPFRKGFRVKTGGSDYVIPSLFLEESRLLLEGDIEFLNKNEVINLHREIIPVIRPEADSVPKPKGKEYAVILRQGSRKLALVVDDVWGESVFFQRSPGGFRPEGGLFKQAAVLDAETTALVLNVRKLFAEHFPKWENPEEDEEDEEKGRAE